MTSQSMNDCCSGINGFSTTESKALKETPEESYNRVHTGKFESKIQGLIKDF